MKTKSTLLSATAILLLLFSQASVLTTLLVKGATIYFSDGFETDNFSQWTSTSNAPTVVSTTVHSGSYAMRAIANQNMWAQKVPTARASYYGRAYVRFDGLPVSGTSMSILDLWSFGTMEVIFGIKNVGGNVTWAIVYDNDDGAPASSNAAPTANVWHCIEMYLTVTAGVRHDYTAWVDGTQVLSGGHTGNNQNIDRLQVGAWDGASAINVYIDDVVLSDSYVGPQGPTFAHISYSSAKNGTSSTFSCEWTSTTGLSGYIFSTNNTGTWVNNTWTALVGNPSWANVTKTLNSAVGLVVGFRWYCNDTLGTWGDTGIQTLVTAGDWQYAKKVYFNNAAVADNLVNFPVLVNLTRAGADFWSHVNSSLNDLRFIDRDCLTELYFDVEYWNYAGKQGLVWVKVPQVDANSATDFIYLQYGNPSPPSPAVFHDSTKVWNGYRLVQHLKETSGTHQDSTPNNNDGSPVNGVLQGVVGRIDGADDFDGTDDYVDLGNSSSLTLTQYTIEAWIRRDGNGVATATSGATGGFTGEPVFAKGTSYSDSLGFNINYFLGINETGNVVGFDFEDVENSGLNHAVLGATALVNGQWYYVVATYDGTSKIFLNGNLDVSTYLGVTPDYCQWDATIGTAISGAGAGTTHGAFNGAVDEVRLASGARSAQWIKAQYLSMTDGYVTFGSQQAPHVPPNKPFNPVPVNGSTNVATSTTLSVNVSHPAASPMNVSFYQAGTEPLDNFTLIALPDTQFYSASYPAIFDSQTQWAVDNAAGMNIVFVTNEGDIVNLDGSTTEWQNANHSLSILDNGDFGWGIGPGNHDLNGGPGTNFNTYFPFSRFNGESWYGGAYNNINTNNYELFIGGEDDYVIIHLQYDSNDTVQAWANTVITSHPNARVIIVTHRFLLADGTRDSVTPVTNLWNNVIAPHADQVFLVLCGHYVTNDVGEASRTDMVNGHPVYQLLADYQTRTPGGAGWLRILEFHPGEDKIYVKTYSPYLSQYETDANSQFTLDYDMSGEAAIPTTLIGTALNVPSGGKASMSWFGLSSLTTYNWYAVAMDSEGATSQSDTWNFTTRVSSDPTFSNISSNTTLAGAVCSLTIKWADPDGLDKCIFSTNKTGTWVNSTIAVSGTESWANTTLTLPSTPGTVVGYRWYCNDTLGNKGDTGIRTLTTSGEWQYALKITFNNSGIGENLVNVPVLVNLTRAGTAFWSHVSSNVNDLRFFDGDPAELYYEVEYWNYAGHQGLVWVKVPQIDASSASDFIWLYHGNLNPPANPYNSPANVWDNGYALVMHLSESSGTRYDSTANNNDGSIGGTPTATAGKLDGACDFDSSADYLEVPDSSSLDYGDIVTLEMWLNPHDVDTNFGGIDKAANTIYLMGANAAGGGIGHIRLGKSTVGTIVASNAVLSENTWTYVVGTKNGATAKIYLNGTLDAQTTTATDTGVNNALNLRIGLRAAYTEYLNSVADEIRISNIARSADWIKAQYLSMTDQYVSFGSEQAPPHPPDKPFNPNPANNATGVPASTTLSVNVTDPDGDAMNVSFYQVNQAQQPAENFTIIVLPDTQYYSASYPAIFDNQTQWIVNNAVGMNILFVTHEGDVIDSFSSATQWQNANHSMSILASGNLPWAIGPGNHDLNMASDTSQFNVYFGTSRFTGKTWYGGCLSGDNANSFEYFINGPDQYMILHLQYNPSNTIMQWANSTLTANPGKRVILVTHEYMDDNNRDTVGNNIWNNFVKYHTDQIFLVLCGHDLGEGLNTDTSTGHTVYQVLADYQGYTNGGNGYLRIMQFRPAEDKIYVKTYSPYLNLYEIDLSSQFTLDYDMTGTPAVPPTLIGKAINVPSGGIASVPWNGLNHTTTYNWYAIADDGNGGKTQSDTWNFTTAANFTLNLNAGWNMVSFPVIPSNTTFASIFSGKGYYQVLTWSGTSYTTPTNVEAGKGYWVLVLSGTTLNIEGSPVVSYGLNLQAGWSMIGSICNKTVVASTVFGANYHQLLTWSGTSYITATTIEPGKGYWVLVLAPLHIDVQ